MKQFIILAFALLIAQSPFAQSGTKNFIDQNYIELTGTSKMEIVPDEIYLNIDLREKDTKNKESIAQLETKMFIALKKIGIDLEKQVKVLDFTSNFQSYWLKKKDVMKSKSFQVIVHDTKTLSNLFATLENVDISNINIVKVDHSKMEEFKTQIKVKAIKNAKTNAETLAEAIDQAVGRAIYIGQGYLNNYEARPMAKRMMVRGMASMDMEEAAPQLEFQKIKLEHKIMVRFELK
tara:strand:+ start:970 stop:1674 length:705 start_codon:yes stop_codon:yes gene_type:complete